MVWLLLGTLFLLLALIILLPAVFKGLKLTDPTLALGLPDGSVRAVIALVLIALFAAAPIYLFNSVSGTERTLTGLDEKAAAKFLDDNKTLHPVVIPVKAGEVTTYTAHYREPSDTAGVDFARQMLVLLGTLATSVTGFYFGAKTATSAAAQAAQSSAPTAPKPELRAAATDPAALPARAANGSIAFKLDLTGSSLNEVKTIKLVSGADQFTFPSKTNASDAICDVACTPKVPAVADWDVSAIDGAGNE